MTRKSGVPYPETKVFVSDIAYLHVAVKRGNTFIPGRLYYPWINGCCIGEGHKTIDAAKRQLLGYAAGVLKLDKATAQKRITAIDEALALIEWQMRESK